MFLEEEEEEEEEDDDDCFRQGRIMFHLTFA